MPKSIKRKSIGTWRGKKIERGQSVDVSLPVSESYAGISLKIPIRIQRGLLDGPVVFVTAALHGDELNGTGAVRQIICDDRWELKRGALILVPILNLLAFDRHSRYLPDRRDLNRCFPGSSDGSLASRIAARIFGEIVARSDVGIDLHTASVRRTNYPNVRADMNNPLAAQLARDFGAEVIVDGEGPRGTLRRESCSLGCPTVVLEGGEVWKVEPAIVETAVRGIKNVLGRFDMIDWPVDTPEKQLIIRRTKWVRADHGGFLQFHVRPGEVVAKDQPLATNTDLLGRKHRVLVSPFNGVIIGMTTLPAISPGEPVCHVGQLPEDTVAGDIHQARSEPETLEQRTVDDLASNVMVTDSDTNTAYDHPST